LAQGLAVAGLWVPVAIVQAQAKSGCVVWFGLASRLFDMEGSKSLNWTLGALRLFSKRRRLTCRNSVAFSTACGSLMALRDEPNASVVCSPSTPSHRLPKWQPKRQRFGDEDALSPEKLAGTLKEEDHGQRQRTSDRVSPNERSTAADDFELSERRTVHQSRKKSRREGEEREHGASGICIGPVELNTQDGLGVEVGCRTCQNNGEDVVTKEVLEQPLQRQATLACQATAEECKELYQGIIDGLKRDKDIMSDEMRDLQQKIDAVQMRSLKEVDKMEKDMCKLWEENAELEEALSEENAGKRKTKKKKGPSVAAKLWAAHVDRRTKRSIWKMDHNRAVFDNILAFTRGFQGELACAMADHLQRADKIYNVDVRAIAMGRVPIEHGEDE